MRQLPHRKAKDFAFCFKCNQSHELPVGKFCQVVGQTSVNSMAETASNSSTSSIPLGQTESLSFERLTWVSSLTKNMQD